MSIEAISSVNIQNRTACTPNSTFRYMPITNNILNAFDEKTRNMLAEKKSNIEKKIKLSKLKELGYITVGFGIDTIDPIIGSAYDIFLQHKLKNIK